jgi:hypothetical protein
LKKIIFFTLIIVTFFSNNVFSQLSFNLLVKKPVPINFSKLQSDPTIVQVMVINGMPQEYKNFKVSFALRGPNGNTVAYSKDTHPKMNKFDIGPNEIRFITSNQILEPDAIGFDQSLYNLLLTTNMLPEGEYLLCVKLVDEFGNVISSPAEKCENINIFHPQPPNLISPANNTTLFNTSPQFVWTPVIGADPTITINYRIKIVKIFEGQTPTAAIDNNIPILDKFVSTTSYQYLPSDVSLSSSDDVVGYAWQVQAVDAITKEPIAAKSGKSEVWAFYPPVKEKEELKLVSPSDNVQFSPTGGFYKFSWDASSIKKQFQNFGIKIVELAEGQSGSSAINSNMPVLFANDINKNLSEYQLKENVNILKNGKRYAWQIYAFDNKQSVVVSSEVRTFTILNQFVEKINLISPQNNTVLALDTSKNAYNFSWDASKVKKSISNFILRIVPLNQGQSPAQAIKQNQPVYLNNEIMPQLSNQMIGRDQGVFENRLYAWQISAISIWFNNQIVAESDVWVFSVTTAIPIVQNVKSIVMNDYTIQVKSVKTKALNNFSGKGEVLLWNGGPVINVDFNGLSLNNIGTSQNPVWKVVKGEINEKIQNVKIDLDFSDSNIPSPVRAGSKYAKSVGTLNIEGLGFTPNSNNIYGTIRLKTPFISKNRNENVSLESIKGSFRVHPQTKIDSGFANLNINSSVKATLVDPKDFVLEFYQGSQFIVSKNKLSLKLNVKVTLPSNLKDRDGKVISVSINGVNGFKFDADLKSVLIYYNLNPDMWIRFTSVNIDLYQGNFFLKEGFIAFDKIKSGGLDAIDLDSKDSTFLTISGLNCKILRTKVSSSTGKFRGYDFEVNDFRLISKSGFILGLSNLSGNIKIPFINQKAKFDLKITKSGISNGEINIAGIDDKWINLFTDVEDGTKLNIKVKGLAYNSSNNTFSMNAIFDFENKPNIGISTGEINITNVRIDSLGGVRIVGANDYGVKLLENAVNGTYNGFTLSIDAIKVIKQNNYLVGIRGNIVLADDLSNDNGTPFSSDIEIAAATGGKDAIAENNLINKAKTSEIPIKFKNNTSDFEGSVKWFNNDAVYGKGFMSEMTIRMKNPSDFLAQSKVMIGKTDNGNGFSYWFVESGAEFSKAIPTGFLDIGINGFTGRVYSKMKHSGKGITSSDYVPDKNNKFGVYAKLPLSSVSDAGRKFWGYTDLEIMVGEGFTAVLHGDLNIFSSGYGVKDGRIKGNATITTSTKPLFFDTEVNVDVNLWNALCGSGKFHVHINDKGWFVKLGTKQQPNVMKVLCMDQMTYKAFLEIYPQYTTLGIMYDFDTGVQTWGEVFGCWGRAWGSIDFVGNVTYQNFNVLASATLDAHANIGVFVDLLVWSGYKTLLEGHINANLEASFPNPMCMAGSVYAEVCFDPCPVVSCDICASATLKLRYKDGSFALKGTCAD